MELYIHIPFCIKKCKYCSFVSFTASAEEKESYVSCVLREAEMRQNEASSPVETIYIGGGTPSILSPSQLTRLVSGIRSVFPFAEETEFSIEANPATLSEEWLSAAVSAGVNRISLGMQAFQPHLLSALGRIHTFSDVMESVTLIRAFHLENYNLDLIFGIPGQSQDEWSETLDAALELAPSHISAYGLIPEEGTPLYRAIKSKRMSLPDPDIEREMYDLAVRKLKNSNFEQYEISNFAKKGFECRHNIGYWTQIPYIGLGVSAASMRILSVNKDGMTCLRTTNPSDSHAYREMTENSMMSQVITETILPPESRFETMMLALRMNRGISDSVFHSMHGISIDSCFGEKLRYMSENGLMMHKNGAWFLTRKGMDVMNSILVEFME